MENKNIFAMLSDHEDNSSDEEKKQKEKQKQKKQKEMQEKKKYAESQNKQVKPDQKKPSNYKSDLQKKQEKKVSDQPHPLDRRSGTGRGKEVKKQGGGAGNWGNTKDIVEEEKYIRKDEQEQTQEEVPQVEEKEALTLDDYLSKYKVEEKETQPQQKKELDLSEFIKEGCQVVQSKKNKNVEEDNKKKKKRGGVKDYSAGMTGEHTELLGIKTGFKPLPEKKPRKFQEDKKEEKKVEEKPQEENQKQEQGEKEQQQEKVEEKEKQYQRGGAKPYSNQNNQQKYNQQFFQGGKRGGRQGGQYQRKEKGDKVDEKDKLKNVQKVIEDEANFPKLG